MLHNQDTRAFVFTKTNGFRHQPIEKGREVLAELPLTKNIQADTTENTGSYTSGELQKYNALISLNTIVDLFNKKQQHTLLKKNPDGGGCPGISFSTDAEHGWPWYGKIAGVFFRSHHNHQETVAKVIDKSHPSIRMLPDEWNRFNKSDNFKEVDPGVMVLAKLDETCFEGSEMNDNHPDIWYPDFEGEQVFYAGLSHPDETFDEPRSESMSRAVSNRALVKN